MYCQKLQIIRIQISKYQDFWGNICEINHDYRDDNRIIVTNLENHIYRNLEKRDEIFKIKGGKLRRYQNNFMEKFIDQIGGKRPLSDAERALRYRQKQKLLKEAPPPITSLEEAKEYAKQQDSPKLKDIVQLNQFHGKLTPDDEKTLAIFIKNRRQKLRQEAINPQTQKFSEAPIQEKIQKITNYEFAELQKLLTTIHLQPERQKVILEKLDENLFLFMDYVANNEPPYNDFLRDIVETHGKIEDNIFIKLFVIVCTKYIGQEIYVSESMAEQAMGILTSSLSNIQASFGLLRLMFQNQIAVSDFPLDLLLKFQARYDQTISSFIKGITKVKRSVIDLLPPTIFLFSSPIIACLQNGADILHRQIPLDFLPHILEIVSYSFANDQFEFEEFLTALKKGCLSYFEQLREAEFINVLAFITAKAIDRNTGFFGSLKLATQAINKSFDLIAECKIDKFDYDTTEKVVLGGQEQYQLIRAQPKVLAHNTSKTMQKLAMEIIRKNPTIKINQLMLEEDLSEKELEPFKAMKMGKLLPVQQIALKMACQNELFHRLFVCYQTGKGKTALCLGIACIRMLQYNFIFIVNQSKDLLFRDFKKACEGWTKLGIIPTLME